MPRKKLGNIRWSKDGTSCRIRVMRDGVNLDRTFHNLTPEQAQAKLVGMVAELGHMVEDEDFGLTLSAYYWGSFRDKPSVRGTKRQGSTMAWYDGSMQAYIEPVLGAVPLREITHAQIRHCVESAASPANCKRTLSAVLRSAYDDGLIDQKPFDRRVPVHRQHKEQVLPWNRFEVIDALKAAQSAPVDIEVYLILGLSGLRKEECLGARPCDIQEQSTYSIVTGERIDTMTVSVNGVFTDGDGWREGAKNEFSARTVPIIEAGRERLRERLTESREAFLVEDDGKHSKEHALTMWSLARIVPYTSSGFYRRWKRWCEKEGLRYIPTNMLRHTSDTLMLTAGIDADLSDRMHGRTEHTSTYASYYRPDVALMEAASRRVSNVLVDESEQC